MAVITGTILPDTLFGTAGADTIDGGLDNDTLFGLGGIDVIVGGEGNDFASGDEGDDDLSGNNGDDVLVGGSGNDSLGGGAGKDTLDGGEGNDTITGAGGNDTLLGGIGDDTLNGGDNADTLEGGLGNDTMNGGNGHDFIFSLAGADLIDGGDGNDIIWFFNDGVANVTTVADASGVDAYDFGSSDIGVSADLRVGNVSNIGLRTFDETVGTVIENVFGSAFGDSIWGNDVNNYLDGRAGGDTMLGGLGNDTYIFDSEFDNVVEAAGEGTADAIRSTASVMSLDENVENLYLEGTADLVGIGNDLSNNVFGNSGHNLIQGWLGADRMVGGAGNDSYVAETVGDIVTEYLDEGIDTVSSAFNHVLSINVENLILLEGPVVLNGTGNSLSNVITGNSNNNVLNGLTGNDTMAGGAGNDTYHVDSTADVIQELPGGGTDIVFATVTFTLGAEVENLTLTGAVGLFGTGNALDNTIRGTGVSDNISGLNGSDTLDGGAGGDAMSGGNGADTYYVDNASDVVVEVPIANDGPDLVYSYVNSYAMTANVENLTLLGSAVTGQGNSGGNRITGNGQANTLFGWGGADRLDGGTGADTMEGGTEGDVYIVDNVGDVVIEVPAGSGVDRVDSHISYVLGADVENLFLLGSGNTSASGNALNNLLKGNTGNNSIYGFGGIDRMEGGAGNDYYYLDTVGCILVENADEGYDRVVTTSFSYVLPNNFEQLDLGVNGDLNGTGNASDNLIKGNNFNNILNGLTGADTMSGKNGDDTYYVDNTADVVTETSSTGGYDRIFATANYTMGANVEYMSLQGSANINGTGNSGVNTIVGNTGNNSLNGMGGADVMSGGTGNDTYFVDTAGDTISETSLGGTQDTVHSSLTNATIALNVENLVLLSGAVTGVGTTANNRITGNDADNDLSGLNGNDVLRGGVGNDTLTGGGGQDTFVFDFYFEGVDTIVDFGVGDHIEIRADGFNPLDPADPLVLVANGAPVAVGAVSQFLYNTTTGELSFDVDGAGGTAASQMAVFTGAPTLTAGDFVVI